MASLASRSDFFFFYSVVHSPFQTVRLCVCSLCSELDRKVAKRFWLSLHCKRPIDLTNSSSFHHSCDFLLKNMDTLLAGHRRNMDSPNSSTLSIRAQFNFQFNFFFSRGREEKHFFFKFDFYEYNRNIFAVCDSALWATLLHGGDVIFKVWRWIDTRPERIISRRNRLRNAVDWFIWELNIYLKKIYGRLCPT